MDTSLLLKMKGRIENFSSEQESIFPNETNLDIFGFLFSSDMAKSNSTQQCTSGSVFNIRVYVKPSSSQIAPKSHRPRIGFLFPNCVTDGDFHVRVFRLGPVTLASFGNTVHERIGC